MRRQVGAVGVGPVVIFAVVFALASAAPAGSASTVTSAVVSASGFVPPIYSPRFVSGDGRYVLFYDDQDGGLHLRDMSAGTNLTVTPAYAYASMSENGRFVVYASGYVHLWDRTTQTSEVVSLDPSGQVIPGDYGQAVSDDGRYIVFESCDSTKCPIYLRDRTAGTTELLSHDANGEPTGGCVACVAMSADGSVVTFTGSDPSLGAVTEVWHRATDSLTQMPQISALSGNGRYAATVTSFPPDFTTSGVIVTDLQSMTSRTVWTDTASRIESGTVSISSDGRYLAFGLADVDSQGNSGAAGQIVRLDSTTGELVPVSVDPSGNLIPDPLVYPNRVGISGDGAHAVFGTQNFGLLEATIAAALPPVEHGVWTWGDNTSGELGDGTTNNHVSPIRVQTPSDASALAGGNTHSLALASDGTVWAWGSNVYGQLGDGTTNQHLSPVQVPGLAGVVSIASGALSLIGAGF